MIDWLIQTDRNIVLAPQEWLSTAEQEQYAAFRFDKRKRDWTRGRWTAKQLIQRVIRRTQARSLPLNDIEILNDPAGVPWAKIEGQRLPLTLSLSHSQDHAFGAVRLWDPKMGMHLGCDIESIEARDTNLFRDYFTQAEQDIVEHTLPPQRDAVNTLIWSAKEAALKAIGLGLKLDTRAVSCLVEFEGQDAEQWQRFQIALDEARLERHVAPLQGWWRKHDDFMVTLVGDALDMEFPANQEAA